MKIPVDNAFKINQLSGSFFPFSVKVTENEKGVRISICAQRVKDVCDLIEKYAKNNLVLFGVDQTSVIDEKTNTPVSLVELATRENIHFTIIDNETILFPKDQLLPLLSTFDHYSLELFDLDKNWNETQLIRQVLEFKSHDWENNNPLLPKLTGSTLFIDSHDDCYLTLEANSHQIAKELFIRTLLFFSGTFFEKKCGSLITFPDFPKELLNFFWKEHFGLTILEPAAEVTNGCINIGVSQKPYNFREEAAYLPDFWILCNIHDQQWDVRK